MSWDRYPDEMVAFADELGSQPETEKAGEQITSESSRFAQTWAASRTLSTSSLGIELPVPRRGLSPVGCNVERAWVTFYFRPDENEAGFPQQADFQMRVRGALVGNGFAVELEDHWRVDTHLYNIVPQPGQPPPNEPHAKFHFQRGGNAQDAFTGQPGYVPGIDLPARQDDTWKALMSGDAPRVPHLPMCPIVAIDYALGQNDGTILRRLRSRPEYAAIVRSCQERLWVPFMESLGNPVNRRRWLGELVA